MKIEIPLETLDQIKRKTSCLHGVVYDSNLREDPGGFRLMQIYAIEIVELLESIGVHVSDKDIDDAGR